MVRTFRTVLELKSSRIEKKCCKIKCLRGCPYKIRERPSLVIKYIIIIRRKNSAVSIPQHLSPDFLPKEKVSFISIFNYQGTINYSDYNINLIICQYYLIISFGSKNQQIKSKWFTCCYCPGYRIFQMMKCRSIKKQRWCY